MGQLVEGQWQRGRPDAATGAADGAFRRAPARFRNWITPDGAPGPTGRGGFAAESGRYHLYVSYACPWAHRTLIVRALKGLAPHIGVSVVHPDLGEDGWTFATDFPGTTGDRLHGLPFLRDLYLRADPRASGRVTVPVLWDRDLGTIVSNESSDILRMLGSAFARIAGPGPDLYPAPLRAEIDRLNTAIYDGLNNGVYRAGFATTQAAYDAAVRGVFATLEMLEARLAARRYLAGDAPTEADWRLFPTLVRFDAVYHGHFRCNRNRLIDFPNLWGYTRELFQMPGIAGTVRMDHIVRHYHVSHRTLNPHGIIPIGPVLDFAAPHGRS